MKDPKLILVTGATGYAGGRLAYKLLEVDYRVGDSKLCRDIPKRQMRCIPPIF
ncbi:MAG: hypothetical protein MUO77_12685 [Anaerolineales bacterium]|nr:hypothetical protein [Anaerolineales bacterium]